MDETILLNKYNEKRDDYFRLLTYSTYVFEITKCCGYSEWVAVYKDAPLSRLCENISWQFGGLKADKLYVMSENGEKLDILCDEECSVRKLVSDNSLFFRAIYPLPSSVIYRIYWKAGCSCNENHDA